MEGWAATSAVEGVDARDLERAHAEPDAGAKAFKKPLRARPPAARRRSRRATPTGGPADDARATALSRALALALAALLAGAASYRAATRTRGDAPRARVDDPAPRTSPRLPSASPALALTSPPDRASSLLAATLPALTPTGAPAPPSPGESALVAELERELARANERASASAARAATSDASRERLWRVVDATRRRAESLESLVVRETCDAETLRPMCERATADALELTLPAKVRSRTTDLRLRRLWGSPADDPDPSEGQGYQYARGDDDDESDESEAFLAGGAADESGRRRRDASDSSAPKTIHRASSSSSDSAADSPSVLLAITAGASQRSLVNDVVTTFLASLPSAAVILFHYDGEVDAWREFPWSRRASHVAAWKQTKWWFAKRFLHPDVVHPYDFLFVWDEDIDVTTDGFDAREYAFIATRNGLKISQPALISGKGAWPVTRRVEVRGPNGEVAIPEMHRLGKDWRGEACLDERTRAPRLRPPCAAYVEIMVPVFARSAWRCVWTLIQSDLSHGWGLDLTWHKCASDPGRNRTAVDGMGIVDAQGVRHLGAPTLGEQGERQGAVEGAAGVSRRRAAEWDLFNKRWLDRRADRDDDRERKRTKRRISSRGSDENGGGAAIVDDEAAELTEAIDALERDDLDEAVERGWTARGAP